MHRKSITARAAATGKAAAAPTARAVGDEARDAGPDEQQRQEARGLHDHDEGQVDRARRGDDRHRIGAAAAGREIGGQRVDARRDEQRREQAACRDQRRDRSEDGRQRPRRVGEDRAEICLCPKADRSRA
jgi:hypothetical protein